MKKKLFIFGIAALLLFGGIMGGLAANDKSDVPPKTAEKYASMRIDIAPDAGVQGQVPPKTPEKEASMRIDVAPNANVQEQVLKTSEKEASVVSNVSSTPDRGPPMPVIREAVIVYFKEMPVSFEKIASTYGGKLIFANQDMKLAAFETRPVGEPGKTNQRTLDFINEISKDSRVEKAYQDRFMFTDPGKAHTLEPDIKYPEYFDKKSVEYISNELVVGFWRMPPSFEEFELKYDAKLKFVDDVLLFAVFETGNATEFLKKISTDPYIRYAFPDTIGYIRYTPNDPGWNLQWGPSNIYSPEAWDYQKGSTTVTIAILDTGVDYNHEDLSGHYSRL